MATNKKTAARQLGVDGEAAVVDWYEQAGYSILERNWRCFEGELDVIAARRKTLVICEVKTRNSSLALDPSLSITAQKQARVRTAAYRWLETQKRPGRLRFDVALVVAGKIQVIEGAF